MQRYWGIRHVRYGWVSLRLAWRAARWQADGWCVPYEPDVQYLRRIWRGEA
jgi:hypothetical protein